MKKLLLIIFTILIICGCSSTSDFNKDQGVVSNIAKGEEMIELIIEDQIFRVHLYDNEAVNQLIECLPMTLVMDDLNQNEKYYYLDKRFTTNTESIGTVNAGDLMLFGSDCLVLFYETFTTIYQYTKIGYLDDIEILKDKLGSESVEVTFRLGQ